jgi:hypothetical protein
MLDPPSLGSLHVIATSPSPAVVDVMDGADGSEIGIVVVGGTVVGGTVVGGTVVGGTVVDEATVVDVVEDVVGVVEGVEVVPVGGK